MGAKKKTNVSLSVFNPEPKFIVILWELKLAVKVTSGMGCLMLMLNKISNET